MQNMCMYLFLGNITFLKNLEGNNYVSCFTDLTSCEVLLNIRRSGIYLQLCSLEWSNRTGSFTSNGNSVDRAET